ncbi:MAG: IS4 family transposase [Polyangiales bacterium]
MEATHYRGVSVAVAQREIAGVSLGDERLEKRLSTFMKGFASAPWLSIPEVSGSRAASEAMYRFMGNEQVKPELLREGHVRNTVARAANEGVVLAISDTTHFEFGGDSERVGLGKIAVEKSQGFFAHATIIVSADGARRPLGLAAIHTWVRPELKRRKRKGGGRLSGDQLSRLDDRESSRWGAQVIETNKRFEGTTEVIHVMDREGDFFTLLGQLVGDQNRFVIRASHDRVARVVECEGGEGGEKMRVISKRAEGVAMRTVSISSRKAKPQPGRRFKAREQREVKLAFGAERIELRCPSYLKSQYAAWIAVNLVRVWELDPPQDVEPVEWLLYTSEPIETPEQVATIVDHYRARWLIEEYFKALKQGCRMEERQLESYAALQRFLAICLPTAWQLLVMRELERATPDAPASAVVSELQLEVLRECSSAKLSDKPPVREVVIAVAMLAGYLPRKNRRPGWLLLGRGLDRLLTLEQGWRARASADQKKIVWDH